MNNLSTRLSRIEGKGGRPGEYVVRSLPDEGAEQAIARVRASGHEPGRFVAILPESAGTTIESWSAAYRNIDSNGAG